MAREILSLIFTIFQFGVITLTIAVLLRTFTLRHESYPQVSSCMAVHHDFVHADDAEIYNVQLETLSRLPRNINVDGVIHITDFITQSYPNIHSSYLVYHEVVDSHSLLYKIQGTDTKLRPYMLSGHLDMVESAEDIWNVSSSFSETIQDQDFTYGRETINNKLYVFGILEALEVLLENGFRPKRSFYIALDHDEEVGGHSGARTIGQVLESRGIQLEFMLAEGMAIMDGIIPAIRTPIAFVATSEKARLDIKLSVVTAGGHSSMPGKQSSIGILAQALDRLEDSPFTSRLGTGPEKGTFEYLAPELIFPVRVVLSNLWLFSPIVSWMLSMKPETDAVIRTTTAFIAAKAGIQDDMLAPYAEATLSHRIHPSQSAKEVIEYDRFIINDPRVNIIILDTLEPLPQSRYGYQHGGWGIIRHSIRQLWGHMDVVVAPNIGTDINTVTRHYAKLTRNMFRFSPIYVYPEDIPSTHGLSERSSSNYKEARNFFKHLILNADNEQTNECFTNQ